MTASEKLKQFGAFNKELAALAGQKIGKKLARRIADWKTMVTRTDFKANSGVNNAFHCPGSHK